MLELLLALAGRRFCPWCEGRSLVFPSWFWDRVPRRIVRLLFPYDAVIGRTGMFLCNRLHGGDR